MLSEINDEQVVQYKGKDYPFKEVLRKIQPGEIIEGISIEYFDSILNRLETERNKEYSYSTDRRYGKWRFILFGIRDDSSSE